MAGGIDEAKVDLWADKTLVHPVGLAALILCILVIFMGPRKWVFPTIFLLACICARQRIVVVTIDFTYLRLLVLVGFIRMAFRAELRGLKWRRLDYAVLAFGIVAWLAYVALLGSGNAVVYRSGWFIDNIGMYFLVRYTVREWDDIKLFARVAATVTIMLGVAFAIEFATARNMFAAFGGIPSVTAMRQGELRCQGAFPHPIIAGCYFAALMPLFGSLYFQQSARLKQLAVVSLLAGTFIIISSNSSTPMMGLFMVIAGGLAWYLRRKLVAVVAIGVCVSIVLHFGMTMPLWWLLTKVDVVGGSTGDHRYRLIDSSLRHFSDWAIMGVPSTWYWGRGMYDITNHYIRVGVRGGIIALMLFNTTIILAFRGLGAAWRRMGNDKPRVALIWGLWTSLFAQSVMFIATTYFGQIIFLWAGMLALMCCADEISLRGPDGPRNGARRPRARGRPQHGALLQNRRAAAANAAHPPRRARSR